jgi:hypothetical protein
VDFSSTTVLDLANGFATITPDKANANNGKFFGDLKFTTPGWTFTDLVYDAQMFNSDASPGFTVTVFDGSLQIGSHTYTGLNHDADLSFALTSTSPITEVDFSSTSGFKEFKHFELSGLTRVVGNPPPRTPLPAALPLFGTGLFGMGFLGWRRKRKAQAAAA